MRNKGQIIDSLQDYINSSEFSSDEDVNSIQGKVDKALSQKPQIVGLKQILESEEFGNDSSLLPIACGVGVDNKPIVPDLAKLPHLLIGGATGQGKSTFLNSLITSLLYSKSPEEIKFLIIDPKMVEFSLYDKIKGIYLVNIEGCEEGVITDSKETIVALNSVVEEMSRRYKLINNAQCRNFTEYNRRSNPKLPYIVVIIDELADLMITYGKQVEYPLARLASKSRAVGIHLVISTQRPSTNVVTGVIKANFPARIAFKVSSMVDSKTIIDCDGAQYLIGRGDMIANFNGTNIRGQSPFIDTPEVEAICEYLSENETTETGPYILPKAEIPDPITVADIDKDPLFVAAAMFFIGYGIASCSMLQKKFGIGYNRASDIMEQLEECEVISEGSDGKPRDILMTPKDFIKIFC